MNQDQLKSRLHYDIESGVFRWRNLIGSSNRKPWDIAGSPHNKGYTSIRIFGKKYMAHRLAWLYVYGELPASDLDHIDGVKTNNAISNLRKVTNAQNHWNVGMRSTNKSGVKGVHWHKGIGRWVATFKANGVQNFVGSFDSISDAESEISKARKNIHGEYARHAVLAEKFNNIGAE